MGRISDIASGKTSVGGGRLSGVVSSESAVEEKNQYYLEVQKKSRYEEAIKKAQKAQEEAQKASENLKFWEGIAGIPKQIYQAGKETGAAILDTAVRTSPLESVINTASGISSVVSGPANVPVFSRYNQGVQESKGRKTLFEKVSGKELTNPDGSINWDAGRQFIGRAAEAPTYIYAGAVQGAEMVGKGLLTRLLTRTIKSTPEAAVNTGIQQFEQGNTENIGTNFLANALLLSGISNIAGEVRFSKEVAKKTISDIESEIGTLSLSEKADVLESIKQGVKPTGIVENVRKVKNNEVSPEELASKINEQAGVTEQQKTEVKQTPEDPLLQEARKYKSAEEFVKEYYTPDSLDLMPGKTRLESLPETGLYHGAGVTNLKSILADGKIRANVSKLDKSGENVVSLSGNRGTAGSYGMVFELDKKLQVKEPPAGTVQGDYYKGFEYRHDGDIPLDNVKSVHITLNEGEGLDSKIMWEYKGKNPEYITAGDLKKQFEDKGIKVFIDDNSTFSSKSKLQDLWKKAQEKPIDTSLPEQPKPDVTLKKESGYAKSLETKAVEKKMASEFQDLAEYTPAVRKEQAQMTTKLINEDIEKVNSILDGKAELPSGMRGSSLALAVEQHAIANNDVKLLQKLAKSKIASGISEAGSELSMLSGRNANSPVRIIRNIIKARKENIVKRLKGKKVSEARKVTKESIKKSINKEAPTKETWSNFIKEIKC